jgi:hypothetical protein
VNGRIGEDEEALMTVVCAWCQHQGRTTVLREKEPFDRPVISHGICDEHVVAFLAEVREAETPAMPPDCVRAQ